MFQQLRSLLSMHQFASLRKSVMQCHPRSLAWLEAWTEQKIAIANVKNASGTLGFCKCFTELLHSYFCSLISPFWLNSFVHQLPVSRSLICLSLSMTQPGTSENIYCFWDPELYVNQHPPFCNLLGVFEATV